MRYEVRLIADGELRETFVVWDQQWGRAVNGWEFRTEGRAQFTANRLELGYDA